MQTENQKTNLMKYTEDFSDIPIRQETKEYTLSYFMKIPNTYQAPKPHPVWWRRWLGQTVSEETGFNQYVMTYEIPENEIDKLWVQKLLTASLRPALYHTLEVEEKTPTEYIRTEGKLSNNKT